MSVIDHFPPTIDRRFFAAPWARWGALVGLLLAEAIILSLLFDAEAAGIGTEWWAPFFRHAILPRVGLTAFAAMGVFGAARFRGEMIADPEEFATLPPRFRLYFSAHLILLAAFAAASSFVLSPSIHTTSFAELWLAVWLVLLLATVGCWAAALLPLPLWQRLARKSGGLFIGALLLGGAAAATYRLNRAWGLLSQSTLWIANSTLRLCFAHTVCDPVQRIVGTDRFSVQIDKQCAGYEGVALVCLFLGAYLWSFRRQLRFPHVLVLIPLGILLSWSGNILRIVALIALGSTLSANVALDGFHSQAGWLLFITVALGLVVLSQRSRYFIATAGGPCPASVGVRASPRELPSAPYIVPLMVVLAIAMLTRAFSASTFDRFYPLRVLACLACLWQFRRAYSRWIWQWNWFSFAIGVGVFILWIGLDRLSPQSASDQIAVGLAAMSHHLALLWIAFRIVGAVIVAPLAEELAFRGYLIRRLIASDFEEVPRRRFTWLSFLLSSILFGTLHGRWIAGTLAGMAFAITVYRRGRIPDAVLAHATSNALLAAYVLWSGAYSFW